MRQLTYIRKRTLEWWDTPEPALEQPSDALVRPFAVARCDLDNAFLQNDLSLKMRLAAASHLIDPRILSDFGPHPFAGPFAYGHECVAEVTAVGSAVGNVRRGDVVVVPFQISCGSCLTCQRELTSHCDEAKSTTGAASTYGLGDMGGGQWGGAMSDSLRVPYADHMLLQVPSGVNPVSLASASDNIADGWRGVGPQLKKNPNAPVLILGGRAKSVGLYAAGLAVAMGASRVDYIDTNKERLSTAEGLGANAIERKKGKRGFSNMAASYQDRYAISFDASGQPGALEFALRALYAGGVCTAAAFYFAKGTRLPVWQMMVKSLRFETGFGRPSVHLPDILSLVQSGQFDPGKVTSLIADWEDAPEALLEPYAKVVVARDPLGDSL